MDNETNWLGWIILVALIWGGYALFSSESEDELEQANVYQPSGTNYQQRSNYSHDREPRITDGYEWAEYYDVSSFDECQDQFGTSYEEDECNRYVKENYYGYDTFNGYECTEDCSGHEAGYNWAEENGIYDESDCGGNSNSFIEGCISYVEDNY